MLAKLIWRLQRIRWTTGDITLRICETMTMRSHVATLALAAGLAAVLATSAGAYSDKIQNYCKDDYIEFCLAHPVGSTAMRRCMEANGKSLSKKCINALVDAGEVPRKFRR